jgi:transcriptional regulator with XRE-family HTH domain
MPYERIRNMRKSRALTQTDVARLLHCSQRVYSNYERGDVDIPTSVLIRLARFHGPVWTTSWA